MVDIDKLERLAKVREKRERMHNRLWIKEMFEKLVDEIPVKSILEELLIKSTKLGRAGQIWKVLMEEIEKFQPAGR